MAPQPRCPIRPGDPCTLCHPGAEGPDSCGLVYLVMSDPDLRQRLAELRREQRAAHQVSTGRPLPRRGPDRARVDATS
jgi:hypothetical protein